MIEEIKNLGDIKEMSKLLPLPSINISEAQLRIEAIKTIKAFKIEEGLPAGFKRMNNPMISHGEYSSNKLAIIAFIKWFYDITEEDLK